MAVEGMIQPGGAATGTGTAGKQSHAFVQRIFLALIAVQVCHSIEEYYFQLYTTFAPAQFVSSLISTNLAAGFLIGNVTLVAFGFLCYVAWVRPWTSSAVYWVWGWALLELANGAGHILIAIAQREFFPGVFTAPGLLVLAILLVGWLTMPSTDSKDSTS